MGVLWVVVDALIALAATVLVFRKPPQPFWAPWLNRPTIERPLGVLQIISRSVVVWAIVRLGLWAMHPHGGDPHHIAIDAAGIAGLLIWARPPLSAVLATALAGTLRLGYLPYVTPALMAFYVLPIAESAVVLFLTHVPAAHPWLLAHSVIDHKGLPSIGATALLVFGGFFAGGLCVGLARRYASTYETPTWTWRERFEYAFERRRHERTRTVSSVRGPQVPLPSPEELAMRTVQARRDREAAVMGAPTDPAIDEEPPMTDSQWQPGDPLPDIDFTRAEFRPPTA